MFLKIKSWIGVVGLTLLMGLGMTLPLGCGGGGKSARPLVSQNTTTHPAPVAAAETHETTKVTWSQTEGAYVVSGQYLAGPLSTEQRTALEKAGVAVSTQGQVTLLTLPPGQDEALLSQTTPGLTTAPQVALLPSATNTPAVSASWADVLSALSLSQQAPPSPARVAVLDTGVAEAGFAAGTFGFEVDHTGSENPTDTLGHGTQVADALVGRSAGQALCGNCVVEVHKVCTAQGFCPVATVLQALVSLRANPPQVVLMSLGAAYDPPDFLAQAFLQELNALKEKGVVVVTPSGNGGGGAEGFFPASLGAPLLVVGGADALGQGRASFANIGSGVGLVAPASGLMLKDHRGQTGVVHGTSFAAALVAAELAVGAALLGDAQKALPHLLAQAKPLAANGLGRGVLRGVDWQAAKTGGEATTPPPTPETPTNPAVSLNIHPSTAEVVVGEEVTFTAQGQDAAGVATALSEAPQWKLLTGAGEWTGPGRLKPLSAGSFEVQATSGGLSHTLRFDVKPTPTLLRLKPAQGRLGAGESLQFYVEGDLSNPQGGLFVPVFSTTAGQISAQGLFTCQKAGTAEVSVKVGEQTAKALVEVTPGPVVSLVVSPGRLSVMAGETVPLSVTAQDAHNNSFTPTGVIWEISQGAGSVMMQGGALLGLKPVTSARMVARVTGFSTTVEVEVTPGLPRTLAATADLSALTHGPLPQSWTTQDSQGNPQSLGGRVVYLGSLPQSLADGSQTLTTAGAQDVQTAMAWANVLSPLWGGSDGAAQLVDGQRSTTLKVGQGAGATNRLSFTLSPPRTVQALMLRASPAAPLKAVTTTCDGHVLLAQSGIAWVSRLVPVAPRICSQIVFEFSGDQGAVLEEIAAFSAATDASELNRWLAFDGNPLLLLARGQGQIQMTEGEAAELKCAPAALSAAPGGVAAFALMARWPGHTAFSPVTPATVTVANPAVARWENNQLKTLTQGDTQVTFGFGGKTLSVPLSVSGGVAGNPLLLSSHVTTAVDHSPDVLYPTANAGTWGFHRTSALLTGGVAQGLVFVGTVSATSKEKARNTIRQANLFFEQQAPPAARLAFLPPTETAAAGGASLASALVQHFTTLGLGIPPGLMASDDNAKAALLARDYANRLRLEKNTPWAVVWVVSEDGLMPDAAIATVLTYELTGTSQPGQSGPLAVLSERALSHAQSVGLAAHELAHLFGALDEYAQSGCTTSQASGYLRAANTGCDETGADTSANLMRNAALALDAPTRDMLGWKTTAGGALEALVPSRIGLSPQWRDTSSGLTPFEVLVELRNSRGDTLPGLLPAALAQGATAQAQTSATGLDGLMTWLVTPLTDTGSVLFDQSGTNATLLFGPAAGPATPDAPPTALLVQNTTAGLWVTWLHPHCASPTQPTADCYALLPGETGYAVYRSTATNGPWELLTLSARAPGYLDTTPLSGAAYFYQVALHGVTGQGPMAQAGPVTFAPSGAGVISVRQNAPPVVLSTLLTNTTATSTTYIKNGDTMTLTVTLDPVDAPFYNANSFSADLSQFGGGGAVTPDTYVPGSGVATWNFTTAGIVTHGATFTATATAAASLTESTIVTDNILSDINGPNLNTKSTSGGGIRLTFSENVGPGVNSTYFTVPGYTVTGTSTAGTVVTVNTSPTIASDLTPAIDFLLPIPDNNARATSLPAGPVTPTDGQAPPAPTAASGIEVNCFLFTADINWTQTTYMSDHTVTEVYRRQLPSGGFVALPTVAVPLTGSTDTLPVAPNGYTYRLRSRDATGNVSTNYDFSIASLSACTAFTSSGVYGAFDNWGGIVVGNQFQAPTDAVVSTADLVYVSDTGNHRIQVLNTSGTVTSTFGSTGSGNGQFRMPQGLGIDGSNNIYVADTINNRIQKFSSAGTYQSQFSFSRPTWVAPDSTGANIFVTSGNDIRKFSSTGVQTTTGGWPVSIAGVSKMVVSGTSLYVMRPDLSQIDVRSTSTGAVTSTVGGSIGSGDGQLINPHGFAIDPAGAIFIADTGNNRVHTLSSTGTFFDLFGTHGYWNADEVNFPLGIARFSTGRLTVVDTGNWRVNFIDPPPTTVCSGTCL